MTTPITTFQTQVEILLGPDDSRTELKDLDIQALIRAAVERYSRDHPDDATDDVTGDGGKYYSITASLDSWVEGFSSIIQIEYPAYAIADDNQPVYLDSEDWRSDYWQGGVRYLFFPNHSPSASETIRVKYTAPYVWAAGDVTSVPGQDFYAVCNLAAGLCCQAIATKYSRTSDSTITSDSVNHTSRSSQFAARAKQYIAYYEEHMGLGGDDGKPPFVQAAGAFIDFDTAPSWQPGRQFLFHGRHTR